MTPEKTIRAFKAIEEIVKEYHGDPVMEPGRLSEREMGMAAEVIDPHSLTQHLLFMSQEGQKLVEAGRVEKAMRWLGFLQGALWGLGITTIEEQKNINRPDEVPYDGKRL